MGRGIIPPIVHEIMGALALALALAGIDLGRGIIEPIGQETLSALDRARARALALAGILKIVFRLSLADQSCKVLHVRSMS